MISLVFPLVGTIDKQSMFETKAPETYLKCATILSYDKKNSSTTKNIYMMSPVQLEPYFQIPISPSYPILLGKKITNMTSRTCYIGKYLPEVPRLFPAIFCINVADSDVI